MVDISTNRIRRAEYTIAASLIIFVGMLAALSFYAGSDDVLEHVSGISLVVVATMLLLSLINYFTRAYRWHIFSDHLQVKVPLKLTILYYFAGFAMTTTPGKLGEAMRLWFLERCHNYDYARVGPLFVGDRLSDMNAMLVLILIGLTAFSDYIWLSVVAAIAVIALTILFLKPTLLIAFVGTLYKWSGKRWTRVFAKIRRTLRFTASIFTWNIFGGTLLLAALGWLAECGALYLILINLGAEITFLHAIFIFSFSMVVGALSMLPGGLGGVEATMLALLVAIGVDMEVAVVATAVIRLTTLWFAVAIGFLMLPFAMQKVRAASKSK